ncbi:MAG: lactate dehydrogenase [Methanoregula sp.]|nr:lactate dehydrogenase [Methanoregula sp.]
MVRCAVLGVGRIGGEVAYLSAVRGLVDELVLYDQSADFLKAQVLDLQHTGLPVTVTSDAEKIRDADICVFAAGLSRTPSVKTRADLLNANLPITRKCAGLLKGFGGIVVTITNPMDVNNYLMHRFTGIPRERCIGFGGQLDSARFSLALKKRGIPGPAYVLGEHGEHQVPVFSTLSQDVPVSRRDEILAELQGASMEVIKGKGGTAFGPAFHISELIRMIAGDTREMIPCSAVLDGEFGLYECSIGVPVKIGKTGITGIEEWALDSWEQEKLSAAGTFVRALGHSVVH